VSRKIKSTEKTEKLQRKNIIKLREKIKNNKPNFMRQESWRYKRIKENWKRPKGIDSKMRKHVKGWPKSPKIGYGGPKKARGLHPSGYKEVIVRNIDELNKIDPQTTAIKIAQTVGMKKRREILIKAKDLGVHVLNPGIIKEKEREEEKETPEVEIEEVKEKTEEEKVEGKESKKQEKPKKPRKRRRKKQEKTEEQSEK
jgi:large subunit ribosomal protein L32e